MSMSEHNARTAAEAGTPLAGSAAHMPIAVDFPVVGLGASAGGLDAFKRFLDAVPANCGMAFVLIQHLDPKHDSMMAELLAGHTAMKVLQAADGMRLEPDHVYAMPPGQYVAIKDGALVLSKPAEHHGARMPFDFFLRSLAQECGQSAMCAVLSGTGTDGSLGVRAVRASGGHVIVQDPEDAGFDGMPQSAINTGVADLVLAVADMPQALIRYGQKPHAGGSRIDGRGNGSARGAFAEIIDLLAAKTPRDFSLYKPGTLQRRIERRMALAGMTDSPRYLDMLRKDASERDALVKDLLINVTRFFRDPAAFELLADRVIPGLVAEQTMDRALRIWVPGCSTGEEAYSLAMIFLEQIAVAKRNIKLQVFASDIDAECVTFARSGIYPEAIAADVPAARLARFFTKDDANYQVVRELRETVVFTGQSILSDAPFSRLDMVSCRNLLIYLSPEAQRKTLSLFHFALRQGGVLFLGPSETVGDASNRFEPISKKLRIYRHISRSQPGEVEFPRGANDTVRKQAKGTAQDAAPEPVSLAGISQRALLTAYAPASVLINAKHEALYYSGAMDRYLKIVSGENTRDVFAMARDGLRAKLRLAIRRAQQDRARTTVTGATVVRDGVSTGVSITVIPVDTASEDLFLASFADDPQLAPAVTGSPELAADISRVSELEKELGVTRQELQIAVHDLEIANEEQKAINEEAMSVNEEFQSTNEELETSKEELQSLNEELTALNGQLHETVEQQRATSSDLQKILISTDVATLFLDSDLNIRFSTPAMKSLFNIIASDVGRPLTDLTRRFKDPDLLPDIRTVLANHEPVRREVKANDGGWFMRGILPYRSDNSGVEGVVITFASIAEMKAAEREIEAARAYLDSIVSTIRQPLVVLDEDLRVISASSSFYQVFSTKPEALIGQSLVAGGSPLNVPAFRDFLISIRTSGASVNDHKVEMDLPGAGRRSFSMSARVLREDPSAKLKILVALVDITEEKRVSKALEAAKAEAERANLAKSRFLAAASHDLRQPLQAISLLQGLLAKRVVDEPTRKLVHRLDETVGTMSGMLDNLLDINQLEAGVIKPVVIDFPVNRLFDVMRAEFDLHTAADGLDWRVVASRLAIRSDPTLLEQIVRNLLSNAVKYTATGKVLLGCRRHGGMLRIEVWDTGPGIPERELKAIFEEFHQLDNVARERSKGLGLGLAIVKRLADLLGHTIDVRSLQGAGSMFAIEVPIGQTGLITPDVLPVPVPAVAPAHAQHASTVLIVDDDPTVLDMLQLLFDGEGYRTIVAADGRLALDAVPAGAPVPDLIIADFNLPNGLTGLETITRLQKRVKHVIPAIILTGDISTASLREISGRGCVHLNKPVRAADLTALVRQLLAHSRAGAQPPRQPEPIAIVAI